MEINYSLKLELTGSDIQALKNILLDSNFRFREYENYNEYSLIKQLLEELGTED